ncbi:MAG: hypothetical protein KGI54_09660 [Pseudomonadota bacterium]|nr:hypothetical protein [Pseudomonadota bacterium]
MALISQGSSADPAFGTVVVAGGGTGLASLTAYELIAAGTTSTGAMQQIGIGSSGQFLMSNGAGSLPSFAALPANNFPWTVVTAATQSISVNNGYFANAATGGVAFTLPVTAAVGTVIRVSGMSGASGWSIAQNASQQIQYGSVATTAGTGGSLASTNSDGDAVEIVCATANTLWVVQNSIGNLSYV